MFELIINGGFGSFAAFATGKYRGCGIIFVEAPQANLKKQMYCVEFYMPYRGEAGAFCKNMFSANTQIADIRSARFYELP